MTKIEKAFIAYHGNKAWDAALRMERAALKHNLPRPTLPANSIRAKARAVAEMSQKATYEGASPLKTAA